MTAGEPEPTPVEKDAVAAAALLPIGAAYAGAPNDLLYTDGAFQVHRGQRRRPPHAPGPGQEHPSVFNPATCVSKGHHTVPVHPRCSQSKPFKLYYEVHGHGPKRIVFLMGLATSCAGWLAQVEHFSNPRNGNTDKYSTLVFDQRGFGSSDVPKGRYRTSDMAHDLLRLLEHLHWTDEHRQVHLVGVSMGGMISLELAKIAPQLWASITLVSTTSGQSLTAKSPLTSLPPFKGVAAFTDVIVSSVLRTKTPAQHLETAINLLFPSVWLDEPHPADKEGRTRRECLRDLFVWRFRYSAHAPPDGILRQLTAVFTHAVSNAELGRINASVPALTIVTGDEDNLVHPANSAHLAAHLDRARFVRLEQSGHALPLQRADELNTLIEDTVALGCQRAQTAYWRERTSQSSAARAVL